MDHRISFYLSIPKLLIFQSMTIRSPGYTFTDLINFSTNSRLLAVSLVADFAISSELGSILSASKSESIAESCVLSLSRRTFHSSLKQYAKAAKERVDAEELETATEAGPATTASD